MSRMSKIIESGLKHKYGEVFVDLDEAEEYMKKRSLVEDGTFKMPKLFYHTKVEVKELFGCQTIIFNENSEHIIIYLHGGAYVDEISLAHIMFCDNIAKKTNSTVFAPLYPLAPNHTFEETYDIVEKLYESVFEMGKPITVMGDSSGGGLSAAFCEYLAVKGLAQPENLILISPWVDISMSGDYEGYVDYDPLYGVDGLREMGKAWAGDSDLKDYRLSPLFGDVSGLAKTAIFVGKQEQLHSDIVKFHDKLKGSGVDVTLIEGEEMTHVYPIYPFVPESKEARNQIAEIILDK